MGSSQSTPSPAAPSDAKITSNSTSNSTDATKSTSISQSNDKDNNDNNNNTTKIKRKPPPKNESGYARAERLCRKKKRIYDACYTAALSSKEEDCEELFDSYRLCFLKNMTRDMEKRGVRVNSGSMVGEFKEEVEDD